MRFVESQSVPNGKQSRKTEKEKREGKQGRKREDANRGGKQEEEF